jgi:hypothetical protein
LLPISASLIAMTGEQKLFIPELSTGSIDFMKYKYFRSFDKIFRNFLWNLSKILL